MGNNVISSSNVPHGYNEDGTMKGLEYGGPRKKKEDKPYGKMAGPRVDYDEDGDLQEQIWPLCGVFIIKAACEQPCDNTAH